MVSVWAVLRLPSSITKCMVSVRSAPRLAEIVNLTVALPVPPIGSTEMILSLLEFTFHFVFDERIYVTNDSDSSDVRALQTRLNELAVSHPSISKIEVSGSFGEETRAAVIEAQRVFGLAMDGLAGPDTWFALAPFDGAAVFSKKSGEVLAITTHADPSFEGSQADAAAEPERGAWIVVAPQGASAGIAE